MPRQARLDAPGVLHHVMVRGIEKRRIVDDAKDRRRFVARLGDAAVSKTMTIYAWSLMGNHAHILLRTGPVGLPSFMRAFLTGYAIDYNHRHGRHGHLFQNRYKSIVCEENRVSYQLPMDRRMGEARELIEMSCKEAGLGVEELRAGSRRGPVRRMRKTLLRRIVTE